MSKQHPARPPRRNNFSGAYSAKVANNNQRLPGVANFSLVELDPSQVVQGVPTEAGFEAPDVQTAGFMREKCPYCQNVALQLVLRYAHVIRNHLFCPQCTRCFDARYPDGSSALTFMATAME